MTDPIYDAVVVGGGPAGLSAATWLSRYRRRLLLLDAGEQRNRWADHTHGYLACDPVSPGELLAQARADLARYPTAELRASTATGASRLEDGRFVLDTDTGPVTSRRLVLATGVRDAFPEVAGFFDHYGTSAFHCPSCDGYEARDRQVVVIGWNEEVADFALNLLHWAAAVAVVTDGRRFEGDAGDRRRLGEHAVPMVEQEAVDMVGRRGDLRGVRLGDGSTLACDMAFFSIAHVPSTTLAEQLGCELDDEGYVVVDECGETAVPGVYAAGDLTPGLQLVQVAAAKGAVAGVGCARSLPVPG